MKVVQISMTEKQIEALKEIVEFRGISQGEIMRGLLDNYFFNEFKKVKYGYIAGIDPSKRRIAAKSFKNTLEGIADDLEGMTDEEATKFVLDSGYLEEDSMLDKDWYIYTAEENGVRGLFYSYKNGSGKGMAYTMLELKGQLKNHFKKLKRNGK